MAGDPRPRPRFAAAGGFTPQTKNTPRLRRSNQGVTPEGLHGSSTSGANLFQEETGLRVEAQVVGLVTPSRNRSRVAEQMVMTLYFFFFFHHFWRVQWVDSSA